MGRSWLKQRLLHLKNDSFLSGFGVSNLTESANSAAFQDGEILILMQSGREVRFSATENPRLASGTLEQLNHMEISPFGIHRPDLDEDLSYRGLLSGDHGQGSSIEHSS